MSNRFRPFALPAAVTAAVLFAVIGVLVLRGSSEPAAQKTVEASSDAPSPAPVQNPTRPPVQPPTIEVKAIPAPQIEVDPIKRKRHRDHARAVARHPLAPPELDPVPGGPVDAGMDSGSPEPAPDDSSSGDLAPASPPVERDSAEEIGPPPVPYAVSVRRPSSVPRPHRSPARPLAHSPTRRVAPSPRPPGVPDPEASGPHFRHGYSIWD